MNQHQASVDSSRKDRERLRLLLDAEPVVAQGATLLDTRAPLQIAPARAPTTADSTSRKRTRTPASSVQPGESASDQRAFDEDVSFTGRSLAIPSQHTVAELAATYVKDHVSFAESRPEYDSMQAVPGAHAVAGALIANLRVALQNHHPTAASISWMIRHLAAAAPSLIVGITGSLVGHLLHTWASATDLAFSHVEALGDRVDHKPIIEMISRQCAEHLGDVGTDPSIFVRQRIRTLQVEQNNSRSEARVHPIGRCCCCFPRAASVVPCPASSAGPRIPVEPCTHSPDDRPAGPDLLAAPPPLDQIPGGRYEHGDHVSVHAARQRLRSRIGRPPFGSVPSTTR